MSSKEHTRYRLLLDEGVHLPQKYPQLNNLHDLLHVFDVNLKGVNDEKIFQFAKQEKRLVVVFNVKDFKKFISGDSPSVIALSTNLSDQQADLKICKVLKKLKPSEKKGHLVSITASGIRITRIVSEENN